LRSWHTRSGRSKTIATGSMWYSRATATAFFRDSSCTFVASSTVSRPDARRFRAT
jgi:hypothetical protein